MKDTYRHQGQRKSLIKILRSKGIQDTKVLNAINTIPRHWFIPAEFESYAYQDNAFPIDSGQTISQPYTVAYQTELLDIKPGDRILEIGTGSGYQAAILCSLGATLYSIERIKELHIQAGELLNKLNLNANLILGDGTKGAKEFAPYDKIIVTAGAPHIPTNYVKQLKTGGAIVIPVGKTQASQKMILAIKQADGSIKHEVKGDFKFVPLLGEQGWKT
ncbi:protein-L-isoaspartate(D-aspartate) O-methyltransferase [Bacteroidia bacterium]|nr:protein-L-isoaspartate(D-aspartate) O-methyltransferase [Bacteroidia bacterium]